MAKAKIYSIEPLKNHYRKGRIGCLLAFVFMIAIVMMGFYIFQRWQTVGLAKHQSRMDFQLGYESKVEDPWKRHILFVGINYPDQSQIGGKVPTVVSLIESDVKSYQVINFSKKQVSLIGQALETDLLQDKRVLEEIGEQVQQHYHHAIHHTIVVDFDKMDEYRDLIETNQYVFSQDLNLEGEFVSQRSPVVLSSRQVKHMLNANSSNAEEQMQKYIEVYYFDLHKLNKMFLSKDTEEYHQAFFEAVSTNMPDHYWALQMVSDFFNYHKLKWM